MWQKIGKCLNLEQKQLVVVVQNLAHPHYSCLKFYFKFSTHK